VKRTKALSEAEKLKMEAQHESLLDEIKAEDAIQKETVSDTGNEPAPEAGATPAEGAAPAAAAAPAAPAKDDKKGE
jgi:hypothetical protein